MHARLVRNKTTIILDLQVGHVGGEAQKSILSVLLWAPTNVGEKHCQVCPKRLAASQKLIFIGKKNSAIDNGTEGSRSVLCRPMPMGINRNGSRLI